MSARTPHARARLLQVSAAPLDSLTGASVLTPTVEHIEALLVGGDPHGGARCADFVLVADLLAKASPATRLLLGWSYRA